MASNNPTKQQQQQPQSLVSFPSASRFHFPSLFQYPSIPSLFEGLGDGWGLNPEQTGLTISEDEKNIYVEAATPGLKLEDIEIDLEQGVLLIRGEGQEIEEDKNKKYYRKSSNSYSYRVALPSHIDEKKEPKAVYKDGVIKLTFNKVQQAQTKKIALKNA